MFVCDFDEYHIQLDVDNTCNIMSYAFMLMIHDNGITSHTKQENHDVPNFQDFFRVPACIPLLKDWTAKFSRELINWLPIDLTDTENHERSKIEES